MLKTIKLIHTLIWAIMAAAVFYIFYAGLTNTSGTLLTICIILLIIETLTLLFNKWTCPLTPLARKYTLDTKDNFDIYLPNWLAKHNKFIFGTLFVIGIILVIFNWLRKS